MPPDPPISGVPSPGLSHIQKQTAQLGNFRRLAVVTCFLTFLLVFIGGLVRVSGAGLGCPDWPQCYGHWFPPLSTLDLPDGIDPTRFNVVLAWIEYFNRAAGIVVGLFIAATSLLALRLRSYPRIFYPALVCLPLVAVLGWQGKDVVESSLLPVIVTIHLVTAILLVGLLTFVAQEAWYEESAQPGEWRTYPQKAKFWILVLALGTISQILLGTIVRGGLDTLSSNFPLYTPLERYGLLTFWRDLHFWSGSVIAIASLLAVVMLRRLLISPSLFVRLPMRLISSCVLLVVAFGITMSIIGPQPLLQLYHLWGATILVGSLVVLYSALARETDKAPSLSFVGRYRRTVLRLGFAVIGMSIIASAVIRSAEESRTNLPIYSIIPPFAGLNQNREEVTETVLDGRITVIECIFTHCRSACPVMGVQTKKLLAEINYSPRVQILSFTVDPALDTPEVMRAYLDSLAPSLGKMRWEFVNLGVDSIRNMCREGLLVSDELPGMHTAKFMLVDERRQLRGYYDHADPSRMEQLRTDIGVLVSRLPKESIR